MMLNPPSIAIQILERPESSKRFPVGEDRPKPYRYRYLKKQLIADGNHCLRCKKKVSLMFIDVDGFKRINDFFGHWVGIQALVEMGRIPIS